MKQKLKSKKFWLSLAGAVVLFLQLLGVKIDAPYVNEIVEAGCGILIVLGLIDSPAPADEQEQDSERKSENEEKQ